MTWCNICKCSIKCEAISQNEKSGTLDLHCKWFKIEKGIDYDYEDIISQLKLTTCYFMSAMNLS